MNKKFDLAIIVVNFMNYEVTIESISKLLRLGNKYLICIVDNNSTNDSFNILKNKFIENENIEILKSDKNGGYSYGNNFAIKYLNNKYEDLKYICIMNPDIFIEYDIFANLINKFKDNEEIVQITGMQIYNDFISIEKCAWKLPNTKELFIRNSSVLKRLFRTNNINKLKVYNKDVSLSIVDVISGCFFIIKNDLFKEIGYFDENVFLYYEENIISKKLSSLGYKAAISINDYFVHAHKAKDNKLLRIDNAKKDFAQILKSQIYFAKEYLKSEKKGYWLLVISGYFHLHVEIPINTMIKKLKSKLRNLK